jgi:hypothetical protein
MSCSTAQVNENKVFSSVLNNIIILIEEYILAYPVHNFIVSNSETSPHRLGSSSQLYFPDEEKPGRGPRAARGISFAILSK